MRETTECFGIEARNSIQEKYQRYDILNAEGTETDLNMMPKKIVV